MINIEEVLNKVPHFETFCSVARLHTLVERLRSDQRFAVDTAGMSTGGVPIHHIRFGTGSIKALLVAGVHCHEPIGGLTVFSLLRLLEEGNVALTRAGVEWHV